VNFIKGLNVYASESVVTQNQIAVVSFPIGLAYQTVLEFDEAGGFVRARYLDYEGNPVDYNGEIIFEFEGEQLAAKAVNGVAEIPFVVVDAGTYVVRTANPDIENDEVTINA